jgi:hypothetical protein
LAVHWRGDLKETEHGKRIAARELHKDTRHTNGDEQM